MMRLNRPDLVARYEAGQSIESIAKDLGGTYANVRWHLLKAGVEMRSSQKLTDSAIEAREGKPIEEVIAGMVAMYTSGASLHAVGERYGITRPAVVKRLRESGVEIRTTSASKLIAFSKMTDEERRNVTVAANNACRGRSHSFENQCLIALGRERVGRFGSVLEKNFSEMLAARDIPTISQKAVGPYSIDLAIEESRIAVEIYGGRWHASKAQAGKHRKRSDHLIDSGWLPVFVWHLREWPINGSAADYVVSLHKAVCRGEADRSQERVIRGDGQLVTVREGDSHDGPAIPRRAG